MIHASRSPDVEVDQGVGTSVGSTRTGLVRDRFKNGSPGGPYSTVLDPRRRALGDQPCRATFPYPAAYATSLLRRRSIAKAEIVMTTRLHEDEAGTCATGPDTCLRIVPPPPTAQPFEASMK
jgi:hypothetical protein